MGIGVAVFLIAIGAILTFAVHATVSGVSLQAIGIILMVVGGIGLVAVLTVFAPRRRTAVEGRTAGPLPRERTVERHDVY